MRLATTLGLVLLPHARYLKGSTLLPVGCPASA